MNRRKFLGTLLGLAVVPVARRYDFDGTNWKVYKDPRLNSSSPLGYKGRQFLETGIVYAPYIPLLINRSLTNQNLPTKMQFL